MVATAAAAGGVYAVIQEPDSSWIVEFATGATIGAVISSCIIGFELFGGARWFDRRGCRCSPRCCCARFSTAAS
jgi:hypothetical protein